MAYELVKVTPHCGAEVRGLNLSQPLDQRTVDGLVQALGRCFGALHLHPAWPRLVEGHPEIMEIYADADTKRIAGEDWHTDVSCDAEPPLGTILQMLEVPEVGGDTLFASMYAAWDALSMPMQKMLASMTALHDGEATYRGRYEGAVEEGKVYPRSVHPIARTR